MGGFLRGGSFNEKGRGFYMVAALDYRWNVHIGLPSRGQKDLAGRGVGEWDGDWKTEEEEEEEKEWVS